MATKNHNLSEFDANSMPDATGMRFGIVVSEWNDNVTTPLMEGAVNTLLANGVKREDIDVMRVPGSFELIDSPVHGKNVTLTLDIEAEEKKEENK
jgi:6,7-dimethyl-8-ribityllumazine synthase